MLTNIVLDEELVEQAISVSGIKTKKEVVKAALQEFVQRHSQRNLLDIAGKISFADGYDYKAMKKDRQY